MASDVNNDKTSLKECTNSECTNDDTESDSKRLQCNKCKRRVHFKCTLLPAYQLQRYLTFEANYSKYLCMNCVNVPEDLNETVPKEIKNNYFEEYEHKLEKSKSFQTKIALLTRKMKEKDTELEMLRFKIRGLEHRMTTTTSGQTKRRRVDEENNEKEVERLRKENESLNERLNERETELDETLQKLAETDSPTNEPSGKNLLKEIEKSMQNRFTEMQKNLTHLIDEKIKVNSCANTGEPTYASTILGYNTEPNNNTGQKQSNQATPINNFRTIMMSTRNEELAEEKDKKLRSCNVIIHGREENNPELAEDEVFVNMMLLRVGGENLKPKSMIRLGNPESNKKRPIKVTFRNEGDKENLMNNLQKLKGKNIYKVISVTDDYTISERNMIKDFVTQARQKNSDEPENSEYVWKVRGTPKNGLIIKRFKKAKTADSMDQ